MVLCPEERPWAEIEERPSYFHIFVTEPAMENDSRQYIAGCLYSRHSNGAYYVCDMEALIRALHEFCFIHFRSMNPNLFPMVELGSVGYIWTSVSIHTHTSAGDIRDDGGKIHISQPTLLLHHCKGLHITLCYVRCDITPLKSLRTTSQQKMNPRSTWYLELHCIVYKKGDC